MLVALPAEISRTAAGERAPDLAEAAQDKASDRFGTADPDSDSA